MKRIYKMMQYFLIPLPLIPSDSTEPFDPELTAEGLVAGRQGRGIYFFTGPSRILKIGYLWWK